MAKKITTTVSSFGDHIKEGYLYIDKTKQIYDLITNDKYYFLARPRRFGKTLLLSTLKEIFSGNRELFKGLWIDSSDYNWKPYPVISLDFSSIVNSDSPEKLETSLLQALDFIAGQHGIDLSIASSIELKTTIFLTLLAKNNNKVVILVDEYDAPIIKNVHRPEVMKGNLEVLKNFFTALKGASSSTLHAFFITGVSQIPKASIFSGINNPKNISLDPRAANLLGYTKEELLTYFSEPIARLAIAEKKSPEELLEKIQFWYNGYRFSEKDETVYNPFSVNYLFDRNKFANYWFNSGTPSFLVELLKKNNYLFEKTEQVVSFKNTEHAPVSEETLSVLTIEDPKVIPLFFQTGYLTISSYSEQTQGYTLDYPNYEVKQAYSLLLITIITQKNSDTIRAIARDIEQALCDKNMKVLCSLVENLFARIPHQIHKLDEKYYHSMMYLLIMLLPFDSDAEKSTSKGRVDLVVKTPDYIYIFEVKINTTAEAALEQIEKRRYYEEYLIDGRTIVLVGIAFNKTDGEGIARCAHTVITDEESLET